MKNKQTKKRLGVLAVMLMLIVAIGATAGTTLAKYVSSATMDAKQATVAQWGYTMTVTENLFGQKYGDTVSDGLASVNNTNGTLVVKGASAGNIVAPGTTGSATFTINGKAEVKSVLYITVDSNFSTVSLTKNDSTYYPIKWTVNDEEVGTNNAASASAVAAAIVEAIDAEEITGVNVSAEGNVVTVELPANTDFGSGLTLNITWAWAFTQGKDEEDTILGQITAGTAGVGSYTAASTTVAFGLSAKVEQVQEFPSEQED